jgi:hypothetical protein
VWADARVREADARASRSHDVKVFLGTDDIAEGLGRTKFFLGSQGVTTVVTRIGCKNDKFFFIKHIGAFSGENL